MYLNLVGIQRREEQLVPHLKGYRVVTKSVLAATISVRLIPSHRPLFGSYSLGTYFKAMDSFCLSSLAPLIHSDARSASSSSSCEETGRMGITNRPHSQPRCGNAGHGSLCSGECLR